MKTNLQIKKTAMMPIGTLDVKLPYYYICGEYFKNYVCVTENLMFITFYSNPFGVSLETKQYDEDDSDLVCNRIERDTREKLFMPIDEAVFMHRFSEVHREIFYAANPHLKPIE